MPPKKAADPPPKRPPKGSREQRRKAAMAAGDKNAEGGKPEGWTGKTPKGLLHDLWLKAKNRYGRPRYETVPSGKTDAHRARCVLPVKDGGRTLIAAPEHPSGTVEEAEHFAALHVLALASPQLQLHRVLAPAFASRWKELQAAAPPPDAPSSSSSGRGGGGGGPPAGPSSSSRNRKGLRDVGKQQDHMVLLSDSVRDAVLEILRAGAAASKSSALVTVGPDGQPWGAHHRRYRHLLRSLSELGFTLPWIHEALQVSVTKGAAINYLCVNCPDLPPQFRADNLVQFVSNSGSARKTSKAAAGTALSHLQKRLVSFGYPQLAVELAVPNDVQEERDAHLRLTHRLRQAHAPAAAPDVDDWEEERAHEIESLQAIFGEDQVSVSDGSLCVPAGDFLLTVLFPADNRYPAELPVLLIDQTIEEVPVSVPRMLNGAYALAADALGSPLIYDLVGFLEAADAPDSFPPAFLGIGGDPGDSDSESDSDSDSDDAPAAGPQQPRRRQHQHQHHFHHNPALIAKMRAHVDGDRTSRDAKRQQIRAVRAKLPAAGSRERIVDTVRTSQVTVIEGGTGCGKSTQIPQYLLEAAVLAGEHCNIVCTQPRRISAIGVSSRVADEWGTPLGDTVGYQVSMDSKRSRNTRLLFCTTGILLRTLLGDRLLSHVTHVVVDEVHERSLDSDFLLIILRELQRRRSDLRIILMSATLDASLFGSYFGGAPVVSIPGFTHPVEITYLEDVLALTKYEIAKGSQFAKKDRITEKMRADVAKRYPDAPERVVNTLVQMDEAAVNIDFLCACVTYLHGQAEPGAILVFLPGMAEIMALHGRLTAALPSSSCWILPLHSTIAASEQRRVFHTPPSGTRKIVLSTNIAETSITIDDVVFVVDTGRVKENRYDPASCMSVLADTWVSRAAATQRKGRAGRVRPGKCFCAFTSRRFESMDPHQKPEMLRVPLHSLVLQALAMGVTNPFKFLNSAIQPPTKAAIIDALEELDGLSALDRSRDTAFENLVLTPLGQHMAALPLDPRIARFLIYASILGVADEALTIAAVMGAKSPFVSPMDARADADRAKRGFAIAQSDHLTAVQAFNEWRLHGREHAFCREHFLSYSTLRTIEDARRQLNLALSEIGFAERGGGRGPPSELTPDRVKIVKAALCAGLYPKVIRVALPRIRFRETSTGALANPSAAKDIKFFVRSVGAASQQQSQQQKQMAIFDDESDESDESDGDDDDDDDDGDGGGVRKLRPNTERVFIHPSSVNFGQNAFDSHWMLYHEKVATSKVYVRDCTVIPPYPLLIFGGRLDVQHEAKTVMVDNWIRFKAPGSVAALFQEIRRELNVVLAKKIENPALELRDSVVARAVLKLLSSGSK